MQLEQQRPRRRCSLARVLVGVVIFALVAFVATHGWLQSLQDVEREVEHLFHPHQMGRDHFVRAPTDGAEGRLALLLETLRAQLHKHLTCSWVGSCFFGFGGLLPGPGILPRSASNRHPGTGHM